MIDLMGKRFGIPWHGLWQKQASFPGTETFVSPSGSTILPPETIQSAGGYSWKIETGAPAVSLTPEELAIENAAGRTWLNYGIAYGTPSNIRLGNRTLTGPLYRDDNGEFWMLELAGGHLTFTRFGLFDNTPVTVTQSIAQPSDISAFHNWSQDCRKFAFTKTTTPRGFSVYSISGVPPAAALTFTTQFVEGPYIEPEYTGPAPNWQVFGLLGNEVNGWYVNDIYTGPYPSSQYYDWYNAYPYPRLLLAPIGAGRVTHNAFVHPIGVMFSDSGSPLPVQIEWDQYLQTTCGNSWGFTAYPQQPGVGLIGTSHVDDTGTYKVTVGGATVLSIPWVGSSERTYAPWTTVEQTLSVLGLSFGETWISSQYSPALGGYILDDLSLLGGAPVDIIFWNTPTWDLKAVTPNTTASIAAFMLTNLVIAGNVGSVTDNKWIFAWRDGALGSSYDITNVPLSATVSCSMHPVTHEFSRSIDRTALVYI